MAYIEDYKDVIKLAYQEEIYYGRSKQQMFKGFRWYNLDVPVGTPKGVEPVAIPTAPSIVNDAADHLAGNWPEFYVKPIRESQAAEKDQERVQIALNSLYDKLAREWGKAIHRTEAIDGAWSGMMCARVGIHDGWDMDNPSADDLYIQPIDPKFVYPDHGSMGREFVIYRSKVSVGRIRQMWPDWEGQWYQPAGWGFWNTGPDSRPRLNERLPDFMVVDWIEYWDDRVKCFIANGHPVFSGTYGVDILPHGLGINPFIIKAAGYGTDHGEPEHKYRSMLFPVFGLLEAEAELWTQYRWITKDTAWPVIIADERLKPIDMTPGSVTYAPDVETVEKGIRTLRNDATDPKAITNIMAWVESTMERATYPSVLRGEAPSGIRAGYPIAILSTQAKLKFAAPSDALRAVLQEAAYKWMAIVKNRVQAPLEVMDGYKIKPDDYDKYYGRVEVKLEPNLPSDKAAMVPYLELAVASLGLPKEKALSELGYEDAMELRELRTAEDLADDPRVREVMAEYFLKYLAPDYANAVQQESDNMQQIQQIQENLQMLQGQLQVLTAQQQMSQLQQPQQPQPLPGLPQGQPQGGSQPAQPPGPWGGARPGSGGSLPGGQNPANPNGIPKPPPAPVANPMTAESEIARQMRSQRAISDLTSQGQLYGDTGTAPV